MKYIFLDKPKFYLSQRQNLSSYFIRKKGGSTLHLLAMVPLGESPCTITFTKTLRIKIFVSSSHFEVTNLPKLLSFTIF